MHTDTHQPLSWQLADVLARTPAGTRLTVNNLLEQTSGRGLFLVMMILCMPFVVPLSIPGTSTLMGGIIMLLAARLILGLEARLPRFIGGRAFPPGLQTKLLSGGVRILKVIERWVRPRKSAWLGWHSVRVLNASLIIFMAFLLALPVPVVFTNTLPSYAIIVLAASMMEEDGKLIWLGYALVVANVIFFYLIGEAVQEVFQRALAFYQSHAPAK